MTQQPSLTAITEIDLLFLDACTVLNLYSTGMTEGILRSLPTRCAIAESVVKESMYVLSGTSSEDPDEREPVDLNPLMSVGLLELLKPETEEEYVAFVSFAADLDDGEAMTCALAVARSGVVATDDRKVQRVALLRAPQLRLVTTTILLKHWAEASALSSSTLSRVLRDVEQRGRFRPGPHDPLQEWWQRSLQSE